MSQLWVIFICHFLKILALSALHSTYLTGVWLKKHNRIRRGEGKGSVWGKNKITTRCLLHPCHHLVYFLKRKSQQINNDASNCSADHDELPFFDGNMLYYFFYLRGCCCDRRMAERNAKNIFFSRFRHRYLYICVP